MAEHKLLLPREATPWEKLNSDVTDDWAHLADDYALIPIGWASPPPAFQPFRVWELGLSPLTPYVPNLLTLISAGVQWQRIRGTPAAIAMGLAWIGYAAAIEEEPTRRALWNRFQLALDRVRDADSPDLARIAGITSLSVPARSIFWRGFAGYDVRACETSYQKTSASLTSDHSGIRLPGIKGSTVVDVLTQWSFGRRYDANVQMGEADLTALGVWIPPVGTSDVWEDADYPWDTADFEWDIPGDDARRAAMANGIVDQTAYVRFSAAGGAVIGYAAAIVRPVSEAVSGPYALGGKTYAVDPASPQGLIVIASSDFGDAAGQTAVATAVVFGGARADGVKPGKNWLSSAQLSGGAAIASQPVSIPFGLTVREQVRYFLRF